MMTRQFALAARTIMLGIRDRAVELYSRAAHRGNYIRGRFAGLDPCGQTRRAAVYVHYDAGGDVADYALHQVRELTSAGCRVTFVSNAPSLSDAARARVAPYVREIIWRHNVGYDFGGYKDGIASLGDLGDLDSLVLMNDSTFGPFSPLVDIIAGIDDSRCDVWAVADNWEYCYHLQSFLLVFFPAALRSEAFSAFWARFPYVNDKFWVVRNGEVGLTQTLAAAGLRSEAMIPYWTLIERLRARRLNQPVTRPLDWSKTSDRALLCLLLGRPANPMHYFWDDLITEFGCPFVKRELLQVNPVGHPAVSRWREVIAGVSTYDPALIESRLQSRLPMTPHTNSEAPIARTPAAPHH